MGPPSLDPFNSSIAASRMPSDAASEISYIEPGPDSDDEFLPPNRARNERGVKMGRNAVLEFTLKRRRNRLFDDIHIDSDDSFEYGSSGESGRDGESDALLGRSPQRRSNCSKRLKISLKKLRIISFLIGGPLCAVSSYVFAFLCDDAADFGVTFLLSNRTFPIFILSVAYSLILWLIEGMRLRGVRGGGVVQCLVALASLGLENESGRRGSNGSINSNAVIHNQFSNNSNSDPSIPIQLDPKTTLAKFLITPITLLFLAPAGREGPTVQLCAGVMWFLGSLFRWTAEEKRAAVLAGAACGVASAFGSPLAGVVFAVEELGHVFDSSVSGIVLVTVAVAGMVTSALPGGGCGNPSIMLARSVIHLTFFQTNTFPGSNGATLSRRQYARSSSPAWHAVF